MNKKPTVTPLQIFVAFLRLGLTAFGGPAMVAYIRTLTVRNKGWLSDNSFKKGVALCQTIPGATAMQVAAYTGLRAGGARGAIAAYGGFSLPAFILMLALSAMYARAHDLPRVIALFTGLQVIVVALVVNATISFGHRYIKDWRDILLSLAVTVFLALGGNPIITILSSAVLGLLLYKQLYLEHKNTIGTAKIQTPWQMIRPALYIALLTGIALIMLFFTRRDLFSLSFLMLKIDLFAFGGGFASVPLLFHEVVEIRQWMSNQTLMDGIALGQITPGPIVITATFVGYLLAGIPGAIVGTVSIFTPSLFLLLLIVPHFDRLQYSSTLQRALRGVLVSFVGLLLAVSIHFALVVHWTPISLLITTAAFTALLYKVNILWVVLTGAGISTLLL